MKVYVPQSVFGTSADDVVRTLEKRFPGVRFAVGPSKLSWEAKNPDEERKLKQVSDYLEYLQQQHKGMSNQREEK